MKQFVLLCCFVITFCWASKPELMLLETYKDQNISGWLMSEKMDGVRAYWDGHQLISRGGVVFAAPSWFTEGLPPFPLDGELWSKRGEFSNIVSIVKKQEPHDGWKELTYNVFDVPQEKGGLVQRLVKLEYYLKLNQADYVRIVKQITCNNEEELQSFLHTIEEGGGEGVVIRNPSSPYVTKRDANSLKIKNFEDEECTVIAHHKGEGKYKKVLGSLTCKKDDGVTFDIGSGFSDDERKNPPAIGSQITYKYKELTQNGKPRFPVFLRIRETL